MRRRINLYFLHVLMHPYFGLADDDQATDRYAPFDANRDDDACRLIREDVLPYLAKIDADSREKVKLALCYSLTESGCVDFTRVIESILPPFEPPSEGRRFFELIWEICFGGDYVLENAGEYEVVENINEPTFSVEIDDGNDGC